MKKKIDFEILRNVDFKDTTELWRDIWDTLKKITKIQLTIYDKRDMLEIYFISIEAIWGRTSYFFEKRYKENCQIKLESIKKRLYNNTFRRINQAYVNNEILHFRSKTRKKYEEEYIYLRDQLIQLFKEINESLLEVLIKLQEEHIDPTLDKEVFT